MAFMSKDWRDPGGEYIKSDIGHWESKKICRLRMFEMLNENLLKRTFHQTLSEFETSKSCCNQNINDIFTSNSSSSGFYQPHITIKQISTKESAIVTSLSEALLVLDFKVAVRDIRRFGYIYRVLEIFITKSLANLSGKAQNYIIELLKEMLNQVILTKNNTNLMRKLLDDLEKTLENDKYNHVGSSQLWKNHLSALEEMKASLKHIDFNEKMLVTSKFQNLPPECIIRIIQNLSCPQDLEMLGLTTCSFKILVDDDLLWKQLATLHFTKDQLSTIMSKFQLANFNWHLVYIRLLQRYGDRHYFPIKLAKCINCSSIFWPIFGHPCSSASTLTDNCIFLSPEDFVNLFQI